MLPMQPTRCYLWSPIAIELYVEKYYMVLHGKFYTFKCLTENCTLGEIEEDLDFLKDHAELYSVRNWRRVGFSKRPCRTVLCEKLKESWIL